MTNAATEGRPTQVDSPPSPRTQAGRRPWLSHAAADLPAGLVVFLVAMPLCLGIAQASGAPLISGLISGAIGGLVVAAVSGSPLSVSGPAAGLAVIVANGIVEVGFRAFLVAVLIAGALQLLAGVVRLGVLAHFFPSAVIKGMLAAIGALICLKQLPQALGATASTGNPISAALAAFGDIHPGPLVVSACCVAVTLAWPALAKRARLKLVPPALASVVVGTLLSASLPDTWAFAATQRVQLPVPSSLSDLTALLVFPDLSHLTDPVIWRLGAALAVVASIESLLSLEAVDKLDPYGRVSPPNRELVAQGLGNVAAGLVGGLPITSVIVRSSANVMAGGRTRLASMCHGALIAVGVLFLGPLLNTVPLAALAVVLLFVGYKLASPTVWRTMWTLGPTQFVPFAATFAAIVATDLLKGTLIGVVVGLAFAVRAQQRNAIVVSDQAGCITVRFTKDLTFLQKARLKEVLRAIPDGTSVTFDRTAVDYVDDDVEEILMDFLAHAAERATRCEVRYEAGGEERFRQRSALVGQAAARH